LPGNPEINHFTDDVKGCIGIYIDSYFLPTGYASHIYFMELSSLQEPPG
jgi:hypothetical protein